MARVNPFRPNSAISPGMFVGRVPQLNALKEALLQTRAGSPKSFMLTGERGIGKTSLLQYFKHVAEGRIPIDGEQLNFLVVDLDIDTTTTDLGLVHRVELSLTRALAKTEPARSFLSKGWAFVQRIEALGVKVRDPQHRASDVETLHDEFAYSLATTTNRIVEQDAASEFGAKYDGVILLIDEADRAVKDLRLGAFLKLLSERLTRHGCQHVMIGLAGMSNLRDILRESHPSSPRIFDELALNTLSTDEVSRVIDNALNEANQTNSEKTTMDAPARVQLINLSEGYPHFIQQFSYSAFAADDDGTIDTDDVMRGALGPMGALEKIGDRYYRDDFYNKIQKDSYRQVLRIMARKDNSWVSKDEIRVSFKGKTTTLDNAIHALRDRKIILAKEGERGMYRLQHRGFALWIKIYTASPDDMHNQLAEMAAHSVSTERTSAGDDPLLR